MAGLDPATHAVATAPDRRGRKPGRMESAWVYMVTNCPNGTLYVGVTTNLARRAWQHREGTIPGFTATYGLQRLVWFEEHIDVMGAIQRERNMKHWRRAWKVRLILGLNPGWVDLYDRISM